MPTAQFSLEETSSVAAPQSSGPHLTKSVTTKVRCFVYAVNSKCYRAECIDLDVVAEGKTEREARRGLRDAMMGYLTVVCDGQLSLDADEKAIRKLIVRPSPMSHRIHYYVGKMRQILQQAVSAKRQAYTKERFYTIPAPFCHC
jgi:hypothetical protein